MRYCLAQIEPRRGDIEQNITLHLQAVKAAVALDADIIIFPELSLTGYEPTLASGLAIAPGDSRFSLFQTISDAHSITIGIGAPIRTPSGITISQLIFQPAQNPKIYSKQYLHPDEEPFFACGQNDTGLISKDTALAICYELSVPEHAARAAQNGAAVYLACVAKSAPGVNSACERLSEIARQHSMTVAMVNCTGLNDGMVCAGQSAAWNNRGDLIGRLDDKREGILLFDTDTNAVLEQYVHM
jgi:predicted amidohydrolase